MISIIYIFLFVAKIFNIPSFNQNIEAETVHFSPNYAILREFLPNYMQFTEKYAVTASILLAKLNIWEITARNMTRLLLFPIIEHL